MLVNIEQLCQEQKCPLLPLPLCRQKGVSLCACILCQKVGRSVKTTDQGTKTLKEISPKRVF